MTTPEPRYYRTRLRELPPRVNLVIVAGTVASFPKLKLFEETTENRWAQLTFIVEISNKLTDLQEEGISVEGESEWEYPTLLKVLAVGYRAISWHKYIKRGRTVVLEGQLRHLLRRDSKGRPDAQAPIETYLRLRNLNYHDYVDKSEPRVAEWREQRHQRIVERQKKKKGDQP